uniref:hypothetical protein n=1 Tax=Thelohanellus kitauei TaxID=669202 RepID=UPI0030018B82
MDNLIFFIFYIITYLNMFLTFLERKLWWNLFFYFPTTISFSIWWNLVFLLLFIFFQVVLGIFLSCFINTGSFCLTSKFLIFKEVVGGWFLVIFHIITPWFIFFFLCLYILKSLLFLTYSVLKLWFSTLGVIIFLLFMFIIIVFSGFIIKFLVSLVNNKFLFSLKCCSENENNEDEEDRFFYPIISKWGYLGKLGYLVKWDNLKNYKVFFWFVLNNFDISSRSRSSFSEELEYLEFGKVLLQLVKRLDNKYLVFINDFRRGVREFDDEIYNKLPAVFIPKYEALFPSGMNQLMSFFPIMLECSNLLLNYNFSVSEVQSFLLFLDLSLDFFLSYFNPVETICIIKSIAYCMCYSDIEGFSTIMDILIKNSHPNLNSKSQEFSKFYNSYNIIYAELFFLIEFRSFI